MALAACLALSARSVAADELQLRNGDRFTGHAIALQGGQLTFKTPYGEVTVPWAEVSALRLDQPMMVTVGVAEPRLTTLEGIAIGDVVAMEAVQPSIVISGGANAGWLATGGNTDLNNLHLDGEVVARRRDDRFTTGAIVNRAEDGERETARNASVAFNYDRFLSEHFFATASTIFTHDRFRDLDLRSAFGAGLGYDVWKTARGTLSVEGGLGYVRENFADATDDSYAAFREGARFATFIVGRQVEAFHRHDGYFGVTGEDNLFFRMQNGLRFALVGGLVSTVQLDLDYDRSPSPGRRTTDRSTSVTFGYRF